MRIAIQDSWPNLPESAEREFIQRFGIACESLGVECRSVVTSDDINVLNPDVVLVSHEFSRKLTGYPTIGLIWSPLSFFRDDPYRVQSLLSYDGYLAANQNIAWYLKDLQAGLATRKPIAPDIFLPTSYRTGIHALDHAEDASLCYIGVHWDGARHRDLFDILSKRGLITCYGPEQSWRHTPDGYGGSLPFDGRSVIETLGKHGMALCLHKAEHRIENTPSMRIFEALSVGALPICDDIEFARKHLAEFATFVDMTQTAGRIADQIEAAIDNVRRRPLEARETARRAKAWFDAHWSLEAKIKECIIPFVEEVAQAGRFRRTLSPRATAAAARRPPQGMSAAAARPACEVVMRSGGRDLSYVRRAMESVKAANSEEFSLGMIVVDYKDRADLRALCDELADIDFPIRYIRSAATGYRSTALWDGLKAAHAPLVAHLDDDDTIFENHYRQLGDALRRHPEMNIAYSGVIRVEDEEGCYISAPNYDGPLNKIIEERRELKFLDVFDLERLARFDNYIQSNAWMGRTTFVQSLLGDDPELVVVEDVYLYLLMAAAGPFTFTGSPTANWHWRSRSSDNSMLAIDQNLWVRCIDRIKMRLAWVSFRSTVTFDRLLNPVVGAVVEQPKKRPESLPPLNYNQALEGGLAFKAGAILDGFHEPEIGGIWSNERDATVLIPLGNRVREEGGVLIIECLGSMSDFNGRWLEVGILDGPKQRLEITDWSLKTVMLPLVPGTASPIIIKITTSHLIAPGDASKEQRELGGFIQSVRVMSAEDAGVKPLRVADLGLPGPWSVSCVGRIARGKLGVKKRVAIAIVTPTAGTLFVGDDKSLLSYARSSNGHFRIPPRLAESSEWFVYQADQPHVEGEVRLEFTDDASDVNWITLTADAKATIQDYRNLDNGAYQHVAAALVGGRLIEGRAGHLYLLLQLHGGKGWWEIRPYYGSIWDVLFDVGKLYEDEHGPIRRGALSDLAAAVANPPGGEGVDENYFVLASILRSVLVGTVAAVAGNHSSAPHEFLLWLADELLPK